MLPYLEAPSLWIPVPGIGRYEVDAFTLLAGVAIVVQFQIVLRRAPRFGIPRDATSSLLGWAIGLGLVSAHVFDVLVYTPERLASDPWLLLRVWETLSSFGGMLGGLAGVFLVMRRRGMTREQRVRFFDCLLFALPFTLAIGRLGCAFLHDHLGVSSTHWLAVAFPEGPRFDLGLLESLYATALAAVFVALDRRRWPDGFFVGAFFLLYGPMRFALDSLRVSEVRYFAWVPGQYLGLAATALGLVLLLWAFARSRE